MVIKQQYYTSTRFGVDSARTGYQVKAQSAAIPQSVLESLGKFIGYRIPTSLDPKLVDQHPVSLRYYCFDAQTALLICSQDEGGPNPGLEAMACGIPVISTRVGVMPELLGDEWLCDRTVDSFSKRLRALSNMSADERIDVGAENRRSVLLSTFTTEGMAPSFERILSFIFSGEDPRPKRTNRMVVVCGSSLGIGGAERITKDLINAFCELGRTDVVGLFDVSTEGSFRKDVNPLASIVRCDNAEKIRSFLDDHRPEILIVNNSWKTFNLIPDVSALCRKSFVFLHGGSPATLELLKQENLDAATGIIVVSDIVSCQIKAFSPGNAYKVSVWNNYVDTDRFAPQPGKSDGHTVGFVGRIARVKRIPDLIDIFRIVSSMDSKARMLIVGGDQFEGGSCSDTWMHEGAIVRSLVEEYNLDDKVEITGIVDDPENHIPRCDVVCLTSEFEGFPLSMLEAMSCGVPCVSVDVGNLRSLFDGKHGEIIDRDESPFWKEKFAQSILTSMKGGKSNRSRAEVEKRHSLKRFTDRAKEFISGHMESHVEVDLSDEVTVFVSTIGSPDFPYCLDHLEKQTAKTKVVVVENVSPMSAAFQRMMDLCETPYYIQVDEDMMLEKDAVLRLYKMAVTAPDRTALSYMFLRDMFWDSLFVGVKIFCHEIVSRYPFDVRSFSCEMSQVQRMKDDGYIINAPPRHDSSFEAGKIGALWDPKFLCSKDDRRRAMFDLFRKFKRDARKWKKGHPVGYIKSMRMDLMKKCVGGHPYAPYALSGLLSGIMDKGLDVGEKGLPTDGDRIEFDFVENYWDQGEDIATND